MIHVCPPDFVMMQDWFYTSFLFAIKNSTTNCFSNPDHVHFKIEAIASDQNSIGQWGFFIEQCSLCDGILTEGTNLDGPER